MDISDWTNLKSGMTIYSKSGNARQIIKFNPITLCATLEGQIIMERSLCSQTKKKQEEMHRIRTM